jgi:uncharacterized protein YdeI (YjbR/CyaY-like superfamily)
MGGDLPSDISEALADRPAVRSAFAASPPSHRRKCLRRKCLRRTCLRRKYLRWVEEAKKPLTRAKRIEAMMVRLTREGAR